MRHKRAIPAIAAHDEAKHGQERGNGRGSGEREERIKQPMGRMCLHAIAGQVPPMLVALNCITYHGEKGKREREGV